MSRPVANGSSVPAWPTLVPRGNDRRMRATTSCEVTPAGLSASSTPSLELVSNLSAEELDERWELEVGGESGGAPVPAAAARARDPGYVDAVVGGPQGHLALRGGVGQLVADEPRHRGPLD